MTKRTIGYMAAISLVLTTIWLVLLIGEQVNAGPMETFEQVRDYTRRLGWVSWVTYINAALITISVTMLFAGLYTRYRNAAPVWSQMGLVFIPVYCAFNLTAYLLQITAVPALLAQPAGDPVAESLLRLLLQSWPASTVAFFNTLAYALLGIPSVLYGVLMAKEGGLLRLAGVLLVLNGFASLLGVIGIFLGSAVLSAGSLIGGVLFLAALFPLSWELLRN